jgi:hypothetical protein
LTLRAPAPSSRVRSRRGGLQPGRGLRGRRRQRLHEFVYVRRERAFPVHDRVRPSAPAPFSARVRAGPRVSARNWLRDGFRGHRRVRALRLRRERLPGVPEMFELPRDCGRRRLHGRGSAHWLRSGRGLFAQRGVRIWRSAGDLQHVLRLRPLGPLSLHHDVSRRRVGDPIKHFSEPRRSTHDGSATWRAAAAVVGCVRPARRSARAALRCRSAERPGSGTRRGPARQGPAVRQDALSAGVLRASRERVAAAMLPSSIG